MVILIIGFQILRLFCVAYGICKGRNFYPLNSSDIFFIAPSMLDQRQKCYGSTFMRYLFIYHLKYTLLKIQIYSLYILQVLHLLIILVDTS